MSSTALLLGLCLALFSVSSFGQQCVQRKEYRDTTDEEWSLFREALLSLQTQPSTQNSGWSEWDDYANFHLNYASQTHNTDMFFPWHRAFLFKLEQRLRSLAPKYANVFIPYWSWSSDWLNAAQTDLLSSNSRYQFYVPYSSKKRNLFGGGWFDRLFGGRNPWQPTTWNPQPGSPPPAPSPPAGRPPPPPPPPPAPSCLVTCHTPNNHCLKRSYNPNSFPRFYSSDALSQMIVKKNGYTDFKDYIEKGSHGQVHTALGGNNGDLSYMTSPNDPIFFMHHAYIDRMWYLWQQLDSGRDSYYPGNLNNRIPGFTQTIGEMVDYERACVGYQAYSADSIMTLNSLRARRSSGAEDPVVTSLSDVSNCLPPPLPDAWVKMNGFSFEDVRKVESGMQEIITRTQASKECAMSTAVDAGGRIEQDDDDIPLGTQSNGTQSVTVKTSTNTIPGWGVGLLVLGAAIIILMAVLVLIVMKQRL